MPVISVCHDLAPARRPIPAGEVFKNVAVAINAEATDDDSNLIRPGVFVAGTSGRVDRNHNPLHIRQLAVDTCLFNPLK
ncbi:hypothetical protein D3C87_1510510 [compost metagenome]